MKYKKKPTQILPQWKEPIKELITSSKILTAQTLNQSLTTHQSVLGPIQAPNGIHVIYVLGQEGEPLSEDQAGNYLYQQAMSKAVPSLMKQLKKQTYVKWVAQPNVSD